jgi:hypothetical protein
MDVLSMHMRNIHRGITKRQDIKMGGVTLSI